MITDVTVGVLAVSPVYVQVEVQVAVTVEVGLSDIVWAAAVRTGNLTTTWVKVAETT